MTNANREPDSASNASSATLNGNDRSQVTPPSSPDGQAKSKKKRNKKKKKKPTVANETKDATPTPVAGTLTGGADTGIADSLGNQMTHIDKIRAAAKDPNTFFNTVNAERRDRAMREAMAASPALRDKSIEEARSRFSGIHQRVMNAMTGKKQGEMEFYYVNMCVPSWRVSIPPQSLSLM